MSADPAMNDSQRLVRIETLLEGDARTRDDHEVRIRRLERWMWLATGLAGGVGGAIGQSLQNLLSGH